VRCVALHGFIRGWHLSVVRTSQKLTILQLITDQSPISLTPTTTLFRTMMSYVGSNDRNVGGKTHAKAPSALDQPFSTLAAGAPPQLNPDKAPSVVFPPTIPSTTGGAKVVPTSCPRTVKAAPAMMMERTESGMLVEVVETIPGAFYPPSISSSTVMMESTDCGKQREVQDAVSDTKLYKEAMAQQGLQVQDDVIFKAVMKRHQSSRNTHHQQCAEARGYLFQHHQQEENRNLKKQHHKEKINLKKQHHKEKLDAQKEDPDWGIKLQAKRDHALHVLGTWIPLGSVIVLGLHLMVSFSTWLTKLRTASYTELLFCGESSGDESISDPLPDATETLAKGSSFSYLSTVSGWLSGITYYPKALVDFRSIDFAAYYKEGSCAMQNGVHVALLLFYLMVVFLVVPAILRHGPRFIQNVIQGLLFFLLASSYDWIPTEYLKTIAFCAFCWFILGFGTLSYRYRCCKQTLEKVNGTPHAAFVNHTVAAFDDTVLFIQFGTVFGVAIFAAQQYLYLKK